MPFQVSCSCGRRLQLAEEHLGKRVRCPACKTIFMAAAPRRARPPEEEPLDVLPAREEEIIGFAPGDDPADDPPPPPRSRKRPRLDDDDDDEPRQPRRRRVRRGTPASEWAATRILDPVALVAGIFAAVLLFMTIKEIRLSRASKTVPQTMRLADLVKNGPGDNSHVILTDFIPGLNYVYLYQKGKYEVVSEASAINRTWSEVWIPLIPLDDQLKAQVAQNPNPDNPALRPSSVQVVIKLKTARDRNAVEQWAGQMTQQQKVQGMVVNVIESLDSQTSNLLKQSYPATDFDKCFIVHEGREPSSRNWVFGGLMGSIALFLVAGSWAACRIVYRNG